MKRISFLTVLRILFRRNAFFAVALILTCVVEAGFGKEPTETSHPRKHLVMVIAEPEYATDRTLPEFARKHLEKDFKISIITWPKADSEELPNIEILNDADIALLSIWRRTPPKEQLDVIRKFIADAKPVVAIRTACHAFAKRDGKVEAGHDAWPQFDTEVIGAHYRGHYNTDNKQGENTVVWAHAESADHPILRGFPADKIKTTSWLYKMTPLQPGATLLLMGRVADGMEQEPVAWTYRNSSGGRTFYTSLGDAHEFSQPWFQQLLTRGIYWAAELPAPE